MPRGYVYNEMQVILPDAEHLSLNIRVVVVDIEQLFLK